MKSVSLRPTAAAFLIVMTLTSCGTLEGRLADASAEQGRVRAGVSLPDLPDDCRRMEAHADIAEGAEVRSVLRRERDALDRQNARTARCATFYDDTRSRFAGGR